MNRPAKNSLCFGLYLEGQQLGYARLITDQTTFAYLCDVFVVESHQHQGLGKWMMESLIHFTSQFGVRRFMLATKDAMVCMKNLVFVLYQTRSE